MVLPRMINSRLFAASFVSLPASRVLATMLAQTPVEARQLSPVRQPAFVAGAGAVTAVVEAGRPARGPAARESVVFGGGDVPVCI